jgi:Fic family protein
LPTKLDGSLSDDILLKAENICIESPKLLGGYNHVVINEIKNLLRITNSYYSNRIESEGTHPVNIEKAMKKDFSTDSKERQLQHLSLAHINTQIQLESNINQSRPIFSNDYLKNIHKLFYSFDGMDEFLNIKFYEQSRRMQIGEFRDNNVKVGFHTPIDYQELNNSMIQYNDIYGKNIERGLKSQKIINIFSSHHRLLWIHPFLDGNGRTSRLFLDMLMHYIGVEGYGMWNISRGLARNNSKYKFLLSQADELRINDYDGRGNLSSRGLFELVDFMLDIALDQIAYMQQMLQISNLIDRIDKYIQFSRAKMYTIAPLPKHSDRLLKELVIKGTIKRGEVESVIGTKQRVASELIRELIERDYIQSDTPRGDIRIKFNAHFAMKIFPDLIPDI